MTAVETTHKIIEGISKGIDFYGLNFPAIKFFKPIIMRMADKYIDNLTNNLASISKKDSIDLNNLLEEMINNVKTTKPFKIKTNVIGDIDICEGKIKFVMPFTEERLVLDIEDLEKIKAMILE